MVILITLTMETFKKGILLLLLLCTSIITQCKVYGVFYVVNGHNLGCPENDVTDLAKLYRSKGAGIYLIRGKSVTKRNVIKYLKIQAEACKEEDMLVFAYSGHGWNNGMQCGNDFIMYSEIINIFNTSKAARKIIFTGACESGGIKYSAKKIKIPSNGHFVAFTAARSNEYSLEQVGSHNSYFYYRVIKGLKGAADTNKDRVITAKELFTYLNKYVRIDVDEDDFEHPTAYGRFSDNLVLMSWKQYVKKIP